MSADDLAASELARAELRGRVHALIDRGADGIHDDDARDRLLADLAMHQATVVPAYARLVAARDSGAMPPALPTDVFRFARIAGHPAELDVRVFRTSGTTSSERGEHAFRDLALYDHAARTFGKRMLFPDRERMRLAFFAPHERELMDSSLSYMLSRFAEWFGAESCFVYQSGGLDLHRLESFLDAAIAANEPVALLGTSFAYVHADDALGARRFALPEGSRILQTGGFKGRSRTVEPPEMLAMLSSRYAVPEPFIVAEYGMTELSSQCYESTLRDALEGRAGPRRLIAPPWMRATPVDPETLGPVADDATGVLRLDDPANLDSVAAIQTADLARRVGDGFVVLGRASGAVPRGCSLAADTALGRA